MEMTPSEQAQLQSEAAMTGFIQWTKRVVLYSLIFLMIVLFACNNGVETGENATGSKYNGEQYDPQNLSVK